MKKFIIKIVLFIFCTVVLICTAILLSNKLISDQSNFKLQNPVKYIVVGDSHPESAYNDSLIDNFSNCAQSGESYFYNYFKIKKIVEDNKQVEVVFLEFNNDQIDKGMDSWIWSQKYLGYKYIKYAPFMEVKDFILLISNNLKGVLANQPLIIERNFNSLIHHKFDLMKDKDLGGYKYLIRDKTDSILSNTPPQNDIIKTDVAYSESNLNYLKKIIDFCKSYNVKLILVRSPIHPKDPSFSNENEFREILKTRFSNVEFLDFKNFPLQNFEYADLGHLNFKGAKKFSVFFNNLLHNNLLQKEQKQLFIDQEIDKLKEL